MKKIVSHMEGCVPQEVHEEMMRILEIKVISKKRHRAKEPFFYEGE